MTTSDPRLVQVLVTCGGSFQGMTVVRGLLAAPGVCVHVADAYEEHVSRYFAHRTWRVPFLRDGETYVASLMEICRAAAIDVIIPATAMDVEVLATHREDFAALGAWVAVCPPELLGRILDRVSLGNLLREWELPILPRVDIREETQLWPLIGKMSRTWGGRGTRIVREAAELEGEDLDALSEDYSWEPYLDSFDEYSVDFALGRDGTCPGWVVRRRRKVFSGFAVVCGRENVPAVEAIMPRLVRAMQKHGARGGFNVQFLLHDGDCYISDLNPRLGTSSTCATAWGMNLPAFLSGAGTWATGTYKGERVVRYLEDLRIPPARHDICGVVFDLDDTLLDQKSWIRDRLVITWETLREKLAERDRFVRLGLQLVEEGHRADMIDRLVEQLELPGASRNDLLTAYRAAVPARGVLYIDVLPTLRELRRRGYRLGVLTDNPPRSQQRKVKVAGLTTEVDAIVYTLQLDAPKPDPAGFAAIADHLELEPHEILMVGDSLVRDLIGASRAGYGAQALVQRPGGFYQFHVELWREEEPLAKSFWQIDSLADLLRVLPDRREAT